MTVLASPPVAGLAEAEMVDMAILDLVGECLIRTDLHGRVLSWNKGAEDLYGYRADQAMGLWLHDLVGRDGCEFEGSIKRELLEKGRWKGELERTTASGQTVTVEAHWSLRRDDQGEPIEVIGTARDVTDRKTMERALKVSDDRYRNLFQAMAASFWELDFSAVGGMLRVLRGQGVTNFQPYFRENPAFVRDMMRVTRVVDINGQTVELFGDDVKKEELLQSVEPFWPEDTSWVFGEAVIAAITGASVYSIETTLQSLAGRRFDAVFTACFPPESVGKGTLLIGVVDISDRVKAQGALAQVEADLAHAARVSMLGELTASIAHEVNQPLAAITTNAEAGLRWLDRANPDLDEIRALTGAIVADARRAADVIARVRSMAARQNPVREEIQVESVIRDVLGFLNHELKSHDVLVSTRFHPALAGATVDRTQFQQVLVNLTMNAIQALAETQGQPRQLSISTHQAGEGFVRIEIEDNGPGVPSAIRDHAFEAFFTTKDHGMGMGLPICRSIVEAHGGQIEMTQRRAGPGALFAFTLPAHPASAADDFA